MDTAKKKERTITGPPAAPRHEPEKFIAPQDDIGKKSDSPPKEPPIIPKVVPAAPSPHKPGYCRYPNTPWWKTAAEMVGIVAVVAYAFISYGQWQTQIDALTLEQRAWISVPFPAMFPLDGTSIPVVTQVINSGQTPARHVEGDFVATIFNKGERPPLGEFAVGHPHNRLYVGIAFPHAPIPVTLTVVHYGMKAREAPDVIVPDDALRQDIANGKRFIIFYGRITYDDVLDTHHWTQFCTGTGPAIAEVLKECMNYNDADANKK